jgi:hypothetical protein
MLLLYMYSTFGSRTNVEASTVFRFKSNIDTDKEILHDRHIHPTSIYLIYVFLHLPFILISVLLFLLYVSLIRDGLTYPNLILKKIPSKKYSNINTKYSDTCSICMDHFSDKDDVRILRCYHVYHMDCIDLWLYKNISCPVCRMSLDKSSLR